MLNRSFIAFVEAFRSSNSTLVEAILSGMRVCFEDASDDNADYDNQLSGDGTEKVIAVSKNLGFDVDIAGNKMSCGFAIPVENGVDMAPKALEDIKRKMAKVGLGFDYTINQMGVTSDGERMRYKVDVSFTAPTYVKDGFEYLMTMEKSDSGTFIFPSEKHRGDDFSKYYANGNNGFVCDHCHSDRLRNVMHVFRKDGRDYTYGTSCAKKYFGINFLDKISRAIYYMFNEFEKFSSGGGAGAKGLSPSYLFNFAFGYFKLYPFYRKADDGVAGTRNEIMHLFNNRSDGGSEYAKVSAAIPPDIGDKFIEFKKFYVTLDAKNEFENNMAVMANSDNVMNREGLFLYAVFNWMKTTGDVPSNKPSQEPRAPSEYAGSVGDKLLFPVVKILKIIPTETQYGTSYIHIMDSLTDAISIDAAKAMVKNGGSIPSAPGGKNDNLVWFASSMSELKEGETYALTGTVTKHNIRNDRNAGDVKQTVIKLVKVADLTIKPKATSTDKKNELSDLIATRIEPVIGPKIAEVADNIMKYSDDWMKRVVYDYFTRTYKNYPFEVITDTPSDVVKAIFVPALRKRISDAVNDYGIIDLLRDNGVGMDVDYKKRLAASVMMLTSAMDKYKDTLIDKCRSYVTSSIESSANNLARNS